MSDFRMPSLGADMTHGTLLEWMVKPGDQVKRGDIVAVVDTEKAAIQVEVFESGVVEELLVDAGAKVPVGTVLARIEPLGTPLVPPTPVERPPSPGARVKASPAARVLAQERGVDLGTIHGTGPDGAIVREDIEAAAVPGAVAAPAAPAAEPAPSKISPLARRIADDLHVDVTRIRGSGSGGTITKADVERAAAARERAVEPSAAQPPEAPTPDRHVAMRQAIAAAVSRSKREIPHYYLGARIDMSRALTWLEAANRERPVPDRLLPAALLLKATASALGKFPEFNGFWVDGGFRPGDGVHLGVAVFLRGGGLIAPAIMHADGKTVSELMTALADLVRRARSEGLRGTELTSATFTVTNLGDRGTDTVFGVIYPPQVAILGFGRIAEQPWAEEGMLAARPVVHVSLAADHRASDGHRGSLFLAEIDRLLQRPEDL